MRSEKRYFGKYGGRYIPEVLYPAFEELEAAYEKFRQDPAFLAEFDDLLKNYVGRPTPLYFAENLTKFFGSAKSFFPV